MIGCDKLIERKDLRKVVKRRNPENPDRDGQAPLCLAICKWA